MGSPVVSISGSTIGSDFGQILILRLKTMHNFEPCRDERLWMMQTNSININLNLHFLLTDSKFCFSRQCAITFSSFFIQQCNYATILTYFRFLLTVFEKQYELKPNIKGFLLFFLILLFKKNCKELDEIIQFQCSFSLMLYLCHVTLLC